MDLISTERLTDLFRHAVTWLSNLKRANAERKLQSKQALRKVISASRETRVYMRQLKHHGQPDHRVDLHLSLLWTALSFELEDLGLGKLAKRCNIKGMHWADPDRYSPEFLARADVSLEKMERLAREALRELNDRPG